MKGPNENVREDSEGQFRLHNFCLKLSYATCLQLDLLQLKL
jgi:hypothetical protein